MAFLNSSSAIGSTLAVMRPIPQAGAAKSKWGRATHAVAGAPTPRAGREPEVVRAPSRVLNAAAPRRVPADAGALTHSKPQRSRVQVVTFHLHFLTLYLPLGAQTHSHFAHDVVHFAGTSKEPVG